MLLYGYGDGGGGVTREMLEVISRSAALPGLPVSRFSTAHDFFDGVREAAPKLPVWSGDMYLELHRGTYTTHGSNKRWNRKAEALYREAEIWNSLSYLSGVSTLEECAELQQGGLQEGWELLLLNQFHDIIPGTSIPEVYVKSAEHYEKIFSRGKEALSRGLEALAAAVDTQGTGTPLLLFNSLSWNRSDAAILTGGAELLNKAPYDAGGNPLMYDLLKTEDSYQMSFYPGRYLRWVILRFGCGIKRMKMRRQLRAGLMNLQPAGRLPELLQICKAGKQGITAYSLTTPDRLSPGLIKQPAGS